MSKYAFVPLPTVVFYQEGPGVRNTQYTETGVKLLNVANLQDGRVDLSTSARYISEEEAYGRYSHFLVDDGDLIIASSGIKVEYFEKKMGFVSKEDLPLCMNTSTIRIKTLDANVLDIRFFMYFLKSNLFKNQIQRLITGSAQLNFGPSHLEQIKVPLPPLSEQKRIAETLDRAQRLIDLRKKQIEEMDRLAQAVFIEMFGDPVRNEKGWEKSVLSEHIDFLTSGSRGWASHYSDSGAFFITIKNVKNGRICRDDVQYVTAPKTQEAIRTRVKENDLLISITADLGRTAVIDNRTAQEEAYINQHLSLIRLKPSINPVFLSTYLESRAGKMQFEAKNQIGVKSGLNFDSIRSLVVIVPPKDMQNEYSAILCKLEEQKQELKRGLSLLVQNFNVLMQRLLL